MFRRCLLLVLALLFGLSSACRTEPSQLASAPAAPEIAISPEAPDTEADLEVQILTEAHDSDGDFAGYHYSWMQDGVERADLADTALVPDLLTARGQLWEVEVTPYDQLGHVGSPASASATIVNSPPSVEVAISPNPAATDSDLVLETVHDDADGDAVVLTVTWARNGISSSSYDGLLTIPGSYTDEGDFWTVQVVPSDGIEDGPTALDTVQVGNAAPTVANFSISPEEPREGDTLTASATVTDVDGDWVTVAYQWFVDSVEVTGQVTTALAPEHFDKHQEVWARVVPTDSKGLSGEAVESNHVTVLNTPPEIDSVEISPGSGGEETTFTCVPVGWVDPDPADPDANYEFQWWVDGAPSLTTETIDGASFDKHDELLCRVVPVDADGSGTQRQSDILEVANTLPTAQSVALVSSETTPGLAFETSTLVALGDGYADVDPEDAVAGWQYEWLVDGQPVAATDATLTGEHFDKGQQVQAVVVPFDGEEAGAPMTSGTIDILNTPPTVASVAISPDPAYTNTSLTAVPAGWSDPDDPPGYHYAWTVGGSAVGTDSPQLDSALFVLGQSVQVTVTPDDGEDQGPQVSSPLPFVIADAAPDAPVVEISPADPRPGSDDLLCTFTAAALDPDGHTVSHAIFWQLDGIGFLGAGTTLEAGDTIASSHTDTGEEWTCVVESSDPQSNSSTGEASVILLIPDFSLLDQNTTSASFAQLISPRDYLGLVSAWYFGDALDTPSLLEFICLEDVQSDLDANHASLGIKLLGVNAPGQQAGNSLMTALVDLPLLQDDATAAVVDSWGASAREIFILDEDNLIAEVYDLAQHDVCVPAERAFLVSLLVNTVSPAGDDDDSASN